MNQDIDREMIDRLCQKKYPFPPKLNIPKDARSMNSTLTVNNDYGAGAFWDGWKWVNLPQIKA